VKENVELCKTAKLDEEQMQRVRKEIGHVPINIFKPTLWPKSS